MARRSGDPSSYDSPPACIGSANGGATQKFGCGGRAASATGAIGALERCRTTAPAESSTSSVIVPDGGGEPVVDHRAVERIERVRHLGRERRVGADVAADADARRPA